MGIKQLGDGHFKYESEVEQSFEPPDKDYRLWELDEALDISLDEFHDMEESPRINLIRTVEGKLLLGNQITIMQALKLLLEEKKDESDKTTT